MKTVSWISFGLAVLILPAMVAAEPLGMRGDGLGRGRRGPPPFMAELFPPDMIMRNQSTLELSDEQKKSIMAAVRETRNSIDSVRWDLENEQATLTRMVSAPSIDEPALLQQAEKVMELEKKLKTSHLLLLVQIKNQLTPEQQKEAKALRQSGRRRLGDKPRRARPSERP